MNEIKQAAVLGSGVMGSGIAAVLANAGIPVLLLDLPAKEGSRNAMAEGAIKKQSEGGTPGFAHKKFVRLVTPGNFEDDLAKLAECDWIVEVVVEKLEIKQDVYRKIDAVRKKGSIVSSNTSTIPLHVLINGLPKAFQDDFLITHFFNPPRFMKLLEVVPSPGFDAKRYDTFKDFADRRLGKGVVPAKDTPGFLANRIGVYWMTAGLVEAMRLGITVEEADAVMGKPLGFPKTGMFGLYDLIGIDLMPLIAQAMMATLPADDDFRKLYQLPDLVKKMIADGYTGRKGKGGFYRMNKGEGGKKTLESLNLKTGEYAPQKKAKLESVDAAKAGLAALFSHPDIGGQYAAAVMLKTLHYAASLIPQISDDIQSVDAAMVMGYAWKYGPFQMIDRLAAGGKTGTEIFAGALQKAGMSVPPIIQQSLGKKLYDVQNGTRQQFSIGGKYSAVPIPEGSLLLEDIKLSGAKPIKKNPSAALWDLGDGVVCLELTSKQNTWDPENLKMVAELPDIVRSNFKAAVVGGDADNFSFGANIGYFMLACNTASWWAISDMVKQGQNAFMGLKYAPFPVVSSLAGMALGGGCELNLHVDAVQAHMESYIGLVEAGIGVIPGWGGCKELLLRHMAAGEAAQKAILSGKKPDMLMSGGPMGPVSKVFEYLSMAKVAGSAAEAQDMLILNSKSRISMNRRRVLADAKALALELAQNYTPPETRTVRLPGKSGYLALQLAVDNFRKSGKATPHDEVVSMHLASVLTGGDTDITMEVSEQQLLDLEHDHFMELVHTQATRDRIAHMLATSKPLRN
ncbi:MAG: 3-hydroxyacyl-CoA dehydrogenase/enoyl-CoA hydratase family protein [Rickettsiales bacterium]